MPAEAGTTQPAKVTSFAGGNEATVRKSASATFSNQLDTWQRRPITRSDKTCPIVRMRQLR